MNKSILFGQVNLVVLSLLFSGCATSQQLLPDFNNNFQSGNFSEAKIIADEKASSNDSLWLLQRATTLRLNKEHNASIQDFDTIEELMKKDDLSSTNDLVKNVTAIVGSEKWTTYKNEVYEGVLVNTYKAMSFIALNDYQNARIEFNRAFERQERAKKHFEEEIQKLEEERQKAKKEEREALEKRQTKAIEPNPEKEQQIKSIIEEKYSNIFAFEPYPDFINPFTSYLAGLFFYLDKDYQKARDLLKETYGMTKSSFVENDFILAENAINNGENNEKYSWIIIEDGLSAIKKEQRIDLPLFVVTDKLYYTGIALPTLEDRSSAYKNYYATFGNGQRESSIELTSMDRVIKTEFKKDFDAVLLRAVSSATIKTLAQYQLGKNHGVGGRIAGAIFGALTTGADERIWSSMPKSFELIRVPSNGKIDVVTQEGLLIFSFDSQNKNSLTFVRIPSIGSNIYHETILF